jgi:histidinol dehydrogenase
MPDQKMTDAEREQKRRARAEKKIAEREAAKAALREQITALASRIPEHVRRGGVQTVHAWKAALDKATGCAELSRVSVDRLKSVSDSLRSQVENHVQQRISHT